MLQRILEYILSILLKNNNKLINLKVLNVIVNQNIYSYLQDFFFYIISYFSDILSKRSYCKNRQNVLKSLKLYKIILFFVGTNMLITNNNVTKVDITTTLKTLY